MNADCRQLYFAWMMRRYRLHATAISSILKAGLVDYASRNTAYVPPYNSPDAVTSRRKKMSHDTLYFIYLTCRLGVNLFNDAAMPTTSDIYRRCSSHCQLISRRPLILYYFMIWYMMPRFRSHKTTPLMRLNIMQETTPHHRDNTKAAPHKCRLWRRTARHVIMAGFYTAGKKSESKWPDFTRHQHNNDWEIPKWFYEVMKS
jgi:hypothetical protein